MPDELLARLDRRVRERGATRSGLLRELAERELASGDERRRRRIEELLSRPGHYGGTGTGAIRYYRNTR